MVKVMMVNIRAATVNEERQELLNGKKRDKDDQIIAADGAKTMAGARAGGDQAEDPERQVAPPARHAAGLGLAERDGAQETGRPAGED